MNKTHSSTAPIIFAMIFANQLWAQTTITLTPFQDGNNGFHTNYNSANTNYGYEDYYGAFSQPGASGGENAAQSIMQFDLSSIPSGAIISSATLDLFGRGATSGSGDATSVGNTGANECYLERVTSAWDQYVVAWNTKPTLSSLNVGTLPQSNSVLQDYLGIDVKQLVQDMVNDPANSYGFSIRLVTEDPTRGLFFCSTDYPDSAKYPRLTITYTGCKAQVTATLGALQDGNNGFHTNYNSANTNYGYEDYYGAFSQPGASGGENAAQSLLQFDLSSYAPGTPIMSARLDLFGRGPVSNSGDATSVGNIGDNQCYLERITSSWGQYVVTWNTKPGLTSTHSVLLPQSQYTIQDYLEIDVTQLVQDMINDPANSFGFSIRLVAEDPTSGLFFCSTDYSDPEKFPVLKVRTCNVVSSTNDITEQAQTISIYPNPANDVAHIHVSGSDALHPLRIVLHDLLGKLIGQFNGGAITDFSFRTTNLSNGIYSISVFSAEKFFGECKLVVQR